MWRLAKEKLKNNNIKNNSNKLIDISIVNFQKMNNFSKIILFNTHKKIKHNEYFSPKFKNFSEPFLRLNSLNYFKTNNLNNYFKINNNYGLNYVNANINKSIFINIIPKFQKQTNNNNNSTHFSYKIQSSQFSSFQNNNQILNKKTQIFQTNFFFNNIKKRNYASELALIDARREKRNKFLRLLRNFLLAYVVAFILLLLYFYFLNEEIPEFDFFLDDNKQLSKEMLNELQQKIITQTYQVIIKEAEIQRLREENRSRRRIRRTKTKSLPIVEIFDFTQPIIFEGIHTEMKIAKEFHLIDQDDNVVYLQTKGNFKGRSTKDLVISGSFSIITELIFSIPDDPDLPKATDIMEIEEGSDEYELAFYQNASNYVRKILKINSVEMKKKDDLDLTISVNAIALTFDFATPTSNYFWADETFHPPLSLLSKYIKRGPFHSDFGYNFIGARNINNENLVTSFPTSISPPPHSPKSILNRK